MLKQRTKQHAAGGGGSDGSVGPPQRSFPAHRVVNTKRALLPQHIEGQEASLRAEGVKLSAAGVVDGRCVWSPSHEELFLTPNALLE